MKDPKQFQDHPVMSLIRQLRTFWVDWSHVSNTNSPRDIPVYEPGIDIEEIDLTRANVASSEVRKDDLFADPLDRTHKVALDIDVPAYLIQSSTPGHSHLYIDVEIPHHRYMALLSALADAGIIERGYAEVSIKRGRSDLRLPWVEKGDKTPERPKVEPPVAPPSDDDLPTF